MTPNRFDALRLLAERIDTGVESPEMSRALIVFNETGGDLDGTALFHAEMSWPLDTPLPPIVVTEIDGRTIRSAVGDIVRRDDAKGRPERAHLSFDIAFAVTGVPARGWKTYLAWFAERDETLNAAVLQGSAEGLIVIETTRHAGNLPPSGTQYAL